MKHIFASLKLEHFPHQLSSGVNGVVFADEQRPNQPRGQVLFWGDGALIQLGQTLGVSLQGPVVCC